MKEEKYDLVDHAARKQYEYHVGDLVARIEYIKSNKGEIYLTHTEVPSQLEGRGIGSRMVGEVLADIERQDLLLVPLCPFVAGYIRKHPEWKRIMKQGVSVE